MVHLKHLQYQKMQRLALWSLFITLIMKADLKVHVNHTSFFPYTIFYFFGKGRQLSNGCFWGILLHSNKGFTLQKKQRYIFLRNKQLILRWYVVLKQEKVLPLYAHDWKLHIGINFLNFNCLWRNRQKNIMIIVHIYGVQCSHPMH